MIYYNNIIFILYYMFIIMRTNIQFTPSGRKRYTFRYIPRHRNIIFYLLKAIRKASRAYNIFQNQEKIGHISFGLRVRKLQDGMGKLQDGMGKLQGRHGEIAETTTGKVPTQCILNIHEFVHLGLQKQSIGYSPQVYSFQKQRYYFYIYFSCERFKNYSTVINIC